MRERIGRYHVRAVLGEGASGTVFHCWDEDLARPVAIKVLTDTATPGEALERFRREARILASLSHPNIVGVFDVGADGSAAYIAMEFVGCPSLRRAIETHAQFTLAAKLEIGRRLCSALAMAHARGVTHRDVKPANILVGADGTAKLVDFGIARLRDSTMTHAFEWLGTPAYASPEALSGVAIDGRADVYSLAVSLYEWIGGRRPHSETATAALIASIVNTDAPDVRTVWPDCPSPVALVLQRGLARNREERFQSAAEFEAGLRGASDALTGASFAGDPAAATRSASPAGAVARSYVSRRVAWVAALTAVAVVALGTRTGVRFGLVPDGRPGPPRKAPQDVYLAATRVLPRAPAPRAAGPVASIPVQASPARADSPPPSSAEAEPPAEEAAPPALPVGTQILVSITTQLRTDRTRVGSAFLAELAEPLSLDGVVVAPAGAHVQGLVDHVFAGTADRPPVMDLQLTQIDSAIGPLAVRTARYRVTGPEQGAGQPRWVAVMIGGAAGAVAGGALGGGKGAAAGGAIGAAAGGAVGGTRPEDRIYSLGNRLTFKLAEDLRVVKHDEERDDDQ